MTISIIDDIKTSNKGFSTEMPNEEYADAQTRYPEAPVTDVEAPFSNFINEDDDAQALLNAIFTTDKVEQGRMSRILRGRKSLVGEQWASALDTYGRVRRKNTVTPGNRIQDMLSNSSFAYINSLDDISYLTDGTHVIAVKDMPAEQLTQARNGALLRNVTFLPSTPAAREVFKAAKTTASSSVIEAKKFYVVDTERCHKSTFVMVERKDEIEMFLPERKSVVMVSERLNRRIDQRIHQRELAEQKAAVAEAERLLAETERIKAEQEAWAMTTCFKCSIDKGEHKYCQDCRRVTCAMDFVNCRRCGKLIGCIRCSERIAFQGRSGATYCNRKEAELAEPIATNVAFRANERRSLIA